LAVVKSSKIITGLSDALLIPSMGQGGGDRSMRNLSFMEKFLDGVEIKWEMLGEVVQYERCPEYGRFPFGFQGIFWGYQGRGWGFPYQERKPYMDA
jgi:hypothetical protein